MRTIERKRPKTAPAFAIVVDGKTEVWYLRMLKRNEPKIRVTIKPEIPDKKSIKEQYNLVCDLSNKEFTEVFWIIDLDSVIKEDNETPKGKESPLKIFKKYRAELKANPNIVVIVNNPCLEFWFLLHFKKTSKYYGSCSSVEKELKNYLDKYEKTQEFFTKQDNDIYLKLKPKLQVAIENAKALGSYDEENSKKAMCEMELLFLSDELKKLFDPKP